MMNLISTVACQLIGEAYLTDCEVRSWAVACKSTCAMLKAYRMKRVLPLALALSHTQLSCVASSRACRRSSWAIGQVVAVRLDSLADVAFLSQVARLPSSLRRVEFVGHFNQPIPRVDWPAGIREMMSELSSASRLCAITGRSHIDHLR
jgi:hypothetical protein